MTPAPSSSVPAVETCPDCPDIGYGVYSERCPHCPIKAQIDSVTEPTSASVEEEGLLAKMERLLLLPEWPNEKAWVEAVETAHALLSTPTPGRAAEPDTMGDPWVDTRLVSFDGTVMFGQGYDGFDQWDDFRMEMHVPGAGSYAVWGSGKKWSFYGGPNGVMAFERFGSRAEAQREAEDYALSVSEWGRTHHALRARAETAEARVAILEQPPCGGCGAKVTEPCRRGGDCACFREFHGGSRAALLSNPKADR